MSRARPRGDGARVDEGRRNAGELATLTRRSGDGVGDGAADDALKGETLKGEDAIGGSALDRGEGERERGSGGRGIGLTDRPRRCAPWVVWRPRRGNAQQIPKPMLSQVFVKLEIQLMRLSRIPKHTSHVFASSWCHGSECEGGGERNIEASSHDPQVPRLGKSELGILCQSLGAVVVCRWECEARAARLNVPSHPSMSAGDGACCHGCSFRVSGRRLAYTETEWLCCCDVTKLPMTATCALASSLMLLCGKALVGVVCIITKGRRALSQTCLPIPNCIFAVNGLILRSACSSSPSPWPFLSRWRNHLIEAVVLAPGCMVGGWTSATGTLQHPPRHCWPAYWLFHIVC